MITMITPEAVEYPDSKKVAAYSRQTQADGSLRVFRQISRGGQSVDYWDGEESLQPAGRSRFGSGQLFISREERWMKQVNVLEAAHSAQKAKKPME